MGEGDSLITCADCGEPFIFTAAQRREYEKRGYSDPKRCRLCRAKRRAWKAAIKRKAS
jgi:hypothetical protein